MTARDKRSGKGVQRGSKWPQGIGTWRFEEFVLGAKGKVPEVLSKRRSSDLQENILGALWKMVTGIEYK